MASIAPVAFPAARAASPSDLSGQYELVLMRANGTVTVLSSLEFLLASTAVPIQELHLEIPDQGIEDLAVYHGYPQITYCLEDGCNHIAEDLSEISEESETSFHGSAYEVLKPVSDGTGYKVNLSHPIKTEGTGSIFITYNLPKVLKGRNQTFKHQAVKTSYQARKSGIAFIPDHNVVLTGPINPEYSPLPVKVEREFNKLIKKQSAQQSTKAQTEPGVARIVSFDRLLKRYNTESDEKLKNSSLDSVEREVERTPEYSHFAQEGLTATAHYSMGGPTLWQRIVNFFQLKQREKQEAIEEKKSAKHAKEMLLRSLYQDEVPEALELYRIVFGSYPQSLTDLKRSTIESLINVGPKEYLDKGGLLSVTKDYQTRVKEEGLSNPLTYQQLDGGKDYKLCTKQPVKDLPNCYSSADRPADGGPIQFQDSNDPQAKEFYAKIKGVHERDLLRETSIGIIQAHLKKYFAQFQKYPTDLAELAKEFPQFIRDEIMNDPSTKQPHAYKVLDNGQDYELCLKGEKLDSGDESLTPQCYNKPKEKAK